MAQTAQTDRGLEESTMLAAVARRGIGRWAMAAALLVIVLAGTILLVGVVLGGGTSEVAGTADLRSLPRFGEMVRRVDRAVRHRDDTAEKAAEDPMQDELGADATTDELAPPVDPPRPFVDRTAFPTEPTPEGAATWNAPGRKSILQVQRYAFSESVDSNIVLTDLAPRHGISYLAEVRPTTGAATGTPTATGGPWHLQNADPAGQLLHATADGLLLVTDDGEEECRLWPGGDPSLLAAAARQGQEFGAAWIPLCGKPARVFLRLPVSGRKTNKERTTDFLRDHLPGGEQMTVLVRKTLFADSELRVGVLEGRTAEFQRQDGAPPRVAVDPRWSDLTTNLGDFGLAASGVVGGKVPVGRWLTLADGRDGVWFSLFQPRLVDDSVVRDSRLQPLDEVELSSMVYLVAFDLDDHDVSFVLGTEHPRLDWSDRLPADVGDRSKPGPDGFNDGAPLVRSGQVPPWRLAELQATFTGGFKRSHSAFKRGDLSRRNDGSHYGFVEDGVVWSKPQPHLATVTVWEDGRVDLHTWTEEDNERLAHVRHLRQNGVPLLAPETGADGTESIRVGSLVGRWGEGNWSGSQDQKLRSVRAGLCLTEGITEEYADEAADKDSDKDSEKDSEKDSDRHLVYGWFSASTPSGMAKVFLAYGCRYALLLDMNALEHTYLSILTPTTDDRPLPATALRVEHLVRGMEVLDETQTDSKQGSHTLPRFAGFADNRDFFYLTRKAESDR